MLVALYSMPPQHPKFLGTPFERYSPLIVVQLAQGRDALEKPSLVLQIPTDMLSLT